MILLKKKRKKRKEKKGERKTSRADIAAVSQLFAAL